MTDETWGDIREALRRKVGENNFTNWIEPMTFVGVDGGVARFSVPTQFMATWVQRNFAATILKMIRSMGETVSRIEVKLPEGSPPAELSAPSLAAAGAAESGDEADDEDEALPGIKLDPRFTFDTFVVGKPNALAHAAARRVAEGGEATFNPLFLYGDVGLGKTHLMNAIANELRRKQPSARVIYLSAEQFMYRFIQALRDKQMMDFKQLFRSVDVLMVDDVQFIAGKESTQEEFFHTFNALVDQNRQIVISGDKAPGEMRGLEDRIRSRLQSGLIVDLHPTNYELRLGILQQKFDYHRDHFANVNIGDGVLEFMALRIDENVRVLEGALMRLLAHGELVGGVVTVEQAQDWLADILRTSERSVTVEEIQRKVSDHYNIRLSDLVGPRRVRTYARPRQIAMYLCKQLTSRSLPEIGRRFGGRDHTTIMHGIRRVEELMSLDRQLAEDVALLRRSLSS